MTILTDNINHRAGRPYLSAVQILLDCFSFYPALSGHHFLSPKKPRSKCWHWRSTEEKRKIDSTSLLWSEKANAVRLITFLELPLCSKCCISCMGNEDVFYIFFLRHQCLSYYRRHITLTILFLIYALNKQLLNVYYMGSKGMYTTCRASNWRGHSHTWVSG